MSQASQPITPDARLQRLLGGAELAVLRTRLRRHFERHAATTVFGTGAGAGAGASAGAGVGAPAEAETDDGVLHLAKLSATDYEAITQLIGRPARPSRTASSSRSVRIDIAALDALLQGAGLASSLRDALEQLDGPIVNRVAARDELQARWSQACGAPIVHGGFKAWLQSATALSLLKRLARQEPAAAAQLLARADAVLQRLPAQGLTRAQLAADSLGNAHALDSGQPTATLVLAVLQQIESRPAPSFGANANANVGAGAAQMPDSPEAGTEGDSSVEATSFPATERARDIWARAGVLVNELARPALFLNLPTHAHSPLQALPGEPGFLSLRQLLRSPITWAVADVPVFVCENPNIVSIAADRLGAHCAPLVCTEGMPAAAQRILLTQLAQAGAKLHYHGDFDWPGLQIGNQVMEHYRAQPWRFGCDDYVRAAETAPHTARDLSESAVSAQWDAQLAAAMQLHGLAIAEEAVVATLLPDLLRTA